jgi:hypothetical protein
VARPVNPFKRFQSNSKLIERGFRVRAGAGIVHGGTNQQGIRALARAGPSALTEAPLADVSRVHTSLIGSLPSEALPASGS